VPTAVVGLVILDPADGAQTNSGSIVIDGMAPPNATVTHDVPMWFDEHTIADATGRWSFTEPLNAGENKFMFRVGDDTATEVTITVYYVPA
jgi:hypothetical protein